MPSEVDGGDEYARYNAPMRLFASVLQILICTAAFGQSLVTPTDSRPEIRTSWETRGEYHDADDVKAIVANAARFNFKVSLFQVRGNGTVSFQTKIEP